MLPCTLSLIIFEAQKRRRDWKQRRGRGVHEIKRQLWTKRNVAFSSFFSINTDCAGIYHINDIISKLVLYHFFYEHKWKTYKFLHFNVLFRSVKPNKKLGVCTHCMLGKICRKKIKADSIADQFLPDCMNTFCADWVLEAQGSIYRAHYFLTDGYRRCQLDI